MILLTLCTLAFQSISGADRLQSVPFTQVHIKDQFWTPRQEINRTVTVDHCFKMLEKAGNLHNFELAIAGEHKGFSNYVFADSDVYKVLEGASETLATHPDPALDRRIDQVIAMLAKAQMPDGYLDTYYEVNAPTKRFTNLRDNHELYCAGHMIEAAVAHYRATGKTNFLDIAKRYADLLYARFGPEGKLSYGGHPELELALVKLADATGDKRYFVLADKLIETRGSHAFAKEHSTPDEEYDGTYWIDDKPIVQQETIKGHAVRAAYLMSGATDVASRTGNLQLETALDRVWKNAIDKRVFLTGGIGPSASNEGFTVDYDLPNESAYQETCASVAMAMWGYRMGLMHANAHYFDAVENALYNAMLAGVSLDGRHFFYVNPLASNGNHARQEWFDCACCPPNALRTIAAIGGYAYAQQGDNVFVNLYLPGSVDLKVADKPVKLVVKGNYPWDGHLTISPEVSSPTSMGLRLRIPGWAHEAKLKVNGREVSSPITEKGYFDVDRTWSSGDSVEIDFPMPVDRVQANPNVKEDLGKEAVRRGPLIYCAEAVDQKALVNHLVLPEDAKLSAHWDGKLLGGIEVVEGKGEVTTDEPWKHTLYQASPPVQETTVRMVPYCDWDNRLDDAMTVWLPTSRPPARVGGPEIFAKVGVSFLSGNAQPEGINDGIEPKSSGEQPNQLMHFWPHKGTEEFVIYSWRNPINVKGVKVYWFDDTGRGECRLPESWHIETMQDGKWTPADVKLYPIKADGWCEVDFPAITTSDMRLVVKMKAGWAAGVRQWKVIDADD